MSGLESTRDAWHLIGLGVGVSIAALIAGWALDGPWAYLIATTLGMIGGDVIGQGVIERKAALEHRREMELRRAWKEGRP